MTLTVIQNTFSLPPNTIVLPWWQTPVFCGKNLGELYKFLELKKHGAETGKTSRLQIRIQIKQYEAIAAQRDWDHERDWPLVWMAPVEPTYITITQLNAYPDWIETLGEFLRIRIPKH